MGKMNERNTSGTSTAGKEGGNFCTLLIIENKYGFPFSNIVKRFNIYPACLYDLFDGDCSFLKSCELETLTNNLGLLVIIKKTHFVLVSILSIGTTRGSDQTRAGKCSMDYYKGLCKQ